MVGDLKKLTDSDPTYFPILFFFQATPAEGREFFDGRWKGARAVADPERVFYRGLGLEKATTGQLMGPTVIACGLRAASKGHVVGKIVGDLKQMPGLFLVKGPTILWHHDFSNIADHPDFATLPELLRKKMSLPSLLRK